MPSEVKPSPAGFQEPPIPAEIRAILVRRYDRLMRKKRTSALQWNEREEYRDIRAFLGEHHMDNYEYGVDLGDRYLESIRKDRWVERIPLLLSAATLILLIAHVISMLW